MTERLPFALLLALRNHLGPNRVLTIIAVLAIATAVTLAAGLEMAARSVDVEIDRTGTEMAGAAQLEVTAGTIGVPDSLLEEVAKVEGVRVAAPLVEATFRIASGPGKGAAIRVIGVDLLADTEVRTYRHANRGARVAEPLRLLAQPGAVITSDALAREFGLQEGAELEVRHGRQTATLTIRGLLEPGGVADAFGGRIAVSDVYLLQTLIGREGWLDRIEIVIAPGADEAVVEARLAQRLAGRATVRRSASRNVWVENTLATVRLVVMAMVVAATLVALLLSNAAMSLFVDRRARELALLRVAGLEGNRVRRLLYVDALLLAAIGTTLGLVGALALAPSFFALLSGVTDFLQDIEISRIEARTSTAVLGLAIGVLVAFAGIWGPARAASRRPPLEELVATKVPALPASNPGGVLVALAVFGAWLAACLLPLGLDPLVRIAAILLLGLSAVVAAGRMLLWPLLAWLRPLLERMLPGIGRLVGASLLARPLQTGLHVAAVAGVLAGVCVSSVLADSLAQTLDSWTASQFPHGIFVSPSAGLSFRNDEPLEPAVVDAIRKTPGVSALFEQYTTDLLYQGEQVLLSASDMGVLAARGRLPALDGDGAAIAREIAGGAIAVSDGFARHFGVQRGDTLTLDTPHGPRAFRVAGLLRDYAGPSGSLNIDLRVFDSLWTRPGARNVVVWTDGDPAPVVRGIEAAVGERQDLFFAYGPELERYASRLLSRFTRILDRLAWLTAALGGVAVMNLMLASVSERRRELALLRSAGATRGQVGALVLIDGAIAGLLGGIAGLVLGLVCAYPLTTGVIADTLGWSLAYSVPPLASALLLVAIVAASMLASVYPALLARRVLARDILAPE